MNLLRLTRSIPTDYHVSGSESAFSASIEQLNASNIMAGLQTWKQYLKSETWAKRRELHRQYYDWCQICHTKHGVQLHHNHYKTLGAESVAGDLIWICKRCHAEIHREEIEYANRHQ